MSVYRSEAFTLKTYSFAELHKLVVFLTRGYGKVRAVAHGAKHTRSRFGSSLELLTRVQLTFQQKENQDLAVIQQCEIIQAFPAYQLSLELNLYFNYFAELLLELSREHADSETLFRLTAATLGASHAIPPALLARYFELWALRVEGVLPPLEEGLPADLAVKTRQMMRLPPERLKDFSLHPSENDTLEAYAGRLIEEHLERSLKTRRMLKQLL
jgi:DNA repair protein RecO (recombination protein O)